MKQTISTTSFFSLFAEEICASMDGDSVIERYQQFVANVKAIGHLQPMSDVITLAALQMLAQMKANRSVKTTQRNVAVAVNSRDLPREIWQEITILFSIQKGWLASSMPKFMAHLMEHPAVR